MSIFLQNLALIQPRTSLVEFARSPRTDPPGDRETLQEIQEDLNRKRPERMKRNAKVVYCAGDTAWVTPYLDNACTTFGASKADQTTGRTIEEMTGQATLPDYRRNLNM